MCFSVSELNPTIPVTWQPQAVSSHGATMMTGYWICSYLLIPVYYHEYWQLLETEPAHFTIVVTFVKYSAGNLQQLKAYMLHLSAHLLSHQLAAEIIANNRYIKRKHFIFSLVAVSFYLHKLHTVGVLGYVCVLRVTKVTQMGVQIIFNHIMYCPKIISECLQSQILQKQIVWCNICEYQTPRFTFNIVYCLLFVFDFSLFYYYYYYYGHGMNYLKLIKHWIIEPWL